MERNDGPLITTDRIIRPDELARFCGVSRKTIWSWWAREDRLPRPLKLGTNVSGWRESTIRAWLEEREAEAERRVA